jgi:hypothetical protein
MKRILFFVFLCSISYVSAQLKVATNGKVGVGITGTPISLLSVGTTGDQYFTSTIEGDKVTLVINGLANSPYDIGYWGTAILATTEVNSTRGDKGIQCGAQKTSPSSSGRAIGLTSYAGNATSGYNYGIIGSLMGSNGGTAVLGTAYGNWQGFYINGTY